MSSVKEALKGVKSAIDGQHYEDAAAQAQKVLALEPNNYHANVFLGLAWDKLNRLDESAAAYDKATKIKSEEPLAWQGLANLYERRGKERLDEYHNVVLRLAELYIERDEQQKCQTVIDKFQAHVSTYGSKAQQKLALAMLLPSSSVYRFLENSLPSASSTYVKIAQITEAEEKEEINKKIGERRTRLGARIDLVNNDVRQEVLSRSALEDIYQSVINWTRDDDERREYEEKLLRHAYDTLLSLPLEKKADKRTKVEELAKGMVIIKHPYRLAWEIVLEWKDGESLAAWEMIMLREYVDLFPEDGLAKVLKGFMGSPLSPTNISPTQSTNQSQADGASEMSTEERLVLMTDGIAIKPHSIICHRLMAEYYLDIEEYEGAVELNRKALELVAAEVRKTGITFENSRNAIQVALATALLSYQTPKNFPEARSLFDKILKQKPTSAPALIGTAHILREQEDYDGALEFLDRAIACAPENVTIKSEAAWCRALLGKYQEALDELEDCLAFLVGSDAKTRNARAETLYRIGVCLWNIEKSPTARKSRSGAYARFLAALQANVNFAPAYTSLGIYYADYGRDMKRAHKCFMKAIELSASEVVAAERLARRFADDRDWDLVELVAQRVVGSGQTRTAPGSKRKAVSWPLTALGVVELNRQEYAKSIVYFQSALRISPEDCHSWIGLGESYYNSGRYIAATRAFHQAQRAEAELQDTKSENTWLAKYMLATVKRELGQYEPAVQEYEEVLHMRPEEFAALAALIRTLVDYAWQSIHEGFRGRAIKYAKRVIDIAAQATSDHPDVFNLWKAVADACAVFSFGHGFSEDFPWIQMKSVLLHGSDLAEYDVLSEVDGAGAKLIDEENACTPALHQYLYSTIFASKRALRLTSGDVHAESVAWYNLGWAEYRAHTHLPLISLSNASKERSEHLRASIQCFKRAIETEAGNGDFWNALGVATSEVSPKISQHSFVRSLILNEKSVRAWTNLGFLCLLHYDYQLANMIFGRAQAIDPEYAEAWLGQGLLALSMGDLKEAQTLLAHAFEISDSFLPLLWTQFAVTTFDRLVFGDTSTSITSLIRPMFALYQLTSWMLPDTAIRHLGALYHEQVGHYSAATAMFMAVCESAEQDYEASESSLSLARFAQGKADLARVLLASYDFTQAAENAETALHLSDADDGDGSTITDPVALQKCRLSAHLTAGLAYFHLHDMDKALDMFRFALEESEGDADVVCLLAQVLWAKGGEKEREVATEQLLHCIEKNPNHLSSTLLLGVVAALDGDQESLQAVVEDLQASRTSNALATEQRQRIERFLGDVAAISSDDETTEARMSIMLSPFAPHGWSALASLSDDPYPAYMALKAAQRAVPPAGNIDPEGLAEAFAATGQIGDMQRAIMVSPWRKGGWEGLGVLVSR